MVGPCPSSSWHPAHSRELRLDFEGHTHRWFDLSDAFQRYGQAVADVLVQGIADELGVPKEHQLLLNAEGPLTTRIAIHDYLKRSLGDITLWLFDTRRLPDAMDGSSSWPTQVHEESDAMAVGVRPLYPVSMSLPCSAATAGQAALPARATSQSRDSSGLQPWSPQALSSARTMSPDRAMLLPSREQLLSSPERAALAPLSVTAPRQPDASVSSWSYSPFSFQHPPVPRFCSGSSCPSDERLRCASPTPRPAPEAAAAARGEACSPEHEQHSCLAEARNCMSLSSLSLGESMSLNGSHKALLVEETLQDSYLAGGLDGRLHPLNSHVEQRTPVLSSSSSRRRLGAANRLPAASLLLRHGIDRADHEAYLRLHTSLSASTLASEGGRSAAASCARADNHDGRQPLLSVHFEKGNMGDVYGFTNEVQSLAGGGSCLRIVRLAADGLLPSWNRTRCGQAIEAGDIIVAVNGIADNAEQMRRHLMGPAISLMILKSWAFDNQCTGQRLPFVPATLPEESCPRTEVGSERPLAATQDGDARTDSLRARIQRVAVKLSQASAANVDVRHAQNEVLEQQKQVVSQVLASEPKDSASCDQLNLNTCDHTLKEVQKRSSATLRDVLGHMRQEDEAAFQDKCPFDKVFLEKGLDSHAGICSTASLEHHVEPTVAFIKNPSTVPHDVQSSCSSTQKAAAETRLHKQESQSMLQDDVSQPTLQALTWERPSRASDAALQQRKPGLNGDAEEGLDSEASHGLVRLSLRGTDGPVSLESATPGGDELDLAVQREVAALGEGALRGEDLRRIGVSGGKFRLGSRRLFIKLDEDSGHIQVRSGNRFVSLREWLASHYWETADGSAERWF